MKFNPTKLSWAAPTTNADGTPIDYATVVEIEGGLRDLKPGRYQAYITVYDGLNPEGLAWAVEIINIQQWKPDV